jgi:hypothetical protein
MSTEPKTGERMSIQRYDIQVGSSDGWMVEADNGEYVLHSDHAALVASLKAERDKAIRQREMSVEVSQKWAARCLDAEKERDIYLNENVNTWRAHGEMFNELACTAGDLKRMTAERDKAQEYAALCRVQFEKANIAADGFQKEAMALKAKLEEVVRLATKRPMTKDEYHRWMEIVDPAFADEIKAMAELKRSASAALKAAKEGA